MQYLGFGFLELGPSGATAKAPHDDTLPLRIIDRMAIVESAEAPAPSTAELATRIRSAADLAVPVGIALRGPDIVGAIAQAEGADYFTIPTPNDLTELKKYREATSRPLCIRIPADMPDEQIDRAVDAAVLAGLNGCVAVTGVKSSLVRSGTVDEPRLRTRALEVIKRIAHRCGKQFDIIGAGGIFTPDDAIDQLAAGAKLVQLHAGLIFAGPGLPGRIVHRLEHQAKAISANSLKLPVSTSAYESPSSKLVNGRDLRWSWQLVAFTGAVLIASGLFALLLAATIKLLPPDERFLHSTVRELCDLHACRIVHFMAHDRVSFGGSIIAIGILYVWLAAAPLRRGEAWAWWAIVISGTIGFGSFLTYLGYGYFDPWHAAATMVLLPIFLAGLYRSHALLRGPRDFRHLFLVAPAWLWSPAGLGRAFLTFSVFGMIVGGLVIMGIGMTQVFVPQDLEFMRVSVDQLHALNPRLVPLIAHDRAGFGGGLCSTGLAALCTLWCGARPGARGLWWATLLAGFVGFATAIGVHPLVGYLSFVHLLPALLGAIAFAIGITLLRKPLFTDGDRFSDF